MSLKIALIRWIKSKEYIFILVWTMIFASLKSDYFAFNQKWRDVIAVLLDNKAFFGVGVMFLFVLYFTRQREQAHDLALIRYKTYPRYFLHRLSHVLCCAFITVGSILLVTVPVVTILFHLGKIRIADIIFSEYSEAEWRVLFDARRPYMILMCAEVGLGLTVTALLAERIKNIRRPLAAYLIGIVIVTFYLLGIIFEHLFIQTPIWFLQPQLFVNPGLIFGFYGLHGNIVMTVFLVALILLAFLSVNLQRGGYYGR